MRHGGSSVQLIDGSAVPSPGAGTRDSGASIRRMLALCMIVILVDQATKTAGSQLGPGPLLRPTTNTRFSLGLAGATLPWMVVLSALGIVAFGAFVVLQALRGHVATWVPAFLVGGAVSNLADRVIAGAVRDFVATAGIVWNLADVAVLFGLAGLAWGCRRQRRPEEHPATEGGETP